MPYMCSQEDTACTLLAVVNGELKDVAKGMIVQPKVRQLHNMPIADNLHKITMVRVLSGYGDVFPPYPPRPADEPNMPLKECKGYVMLWPKANIRLSITPQNTPPIPTSTQGKTTPLDPSNLGQSEPEGGP